MNKNTNSEPILRSATISKNRLDSLKKQLKKVPHFWRKRFVQNKWQMILTDKMPNEYGGMFGRIFVNPSKKQIWLNVAVLDVFSNIIYVSFAYYIIMEYISLEDSATYTKLVNKNKQAITIFMTSRGNTSVTLDSIFAEIFAFVIETDGKNQFTPIDEIYQYVKKWVDGSIFNRNISVPRYIEIGIDVFDEQIEIIDNVFKNLPSKLQLMFLIKSWKLKVSHEKITKDNVYGLCSSLDKRIFIRSSARDLERIVLHEFGHYLDMEEGLLSNRPVFKTIFLQEGHLVKKLYSNDEEFKYGTSNSEEYFADIFWYYMTNSFELKDCAVQSFKFINELVKRWR